MGVGVEGELAAGHVGEGEVARLGVALEGLAEALQVSVLERGGRFHKAVDFIAKMGPLLKIDDVHIKLRRESCLYKISKDHFPQKGLSLLYYSLNETEPFQ